MEHFDMLIVYGEKNVIGIELAGSRLIKLPRQVLTLCSPFLYVFPFEYQCRSISLFVSLFLYSSTLAVVIFRPRRMLSVSITKFNTFG